MLLNNPNEMDANPFGDPTDSDIEDANVCFNLLDKTPKMTLKMILLTLICRFVIVIFYKNTKIYHSENF